MLKYGIERRYIPNKLYFKQLKEEEKIKEIYTPEEFALLLKKNNVKKWSFTECHNWVIVNFLLEIGVEPEVWGQNEHRANQFKELVFSLVTKLDEEVKSHFILK